MRPTFSIIFFTVMSGAGYGLWFLIGLGLAIHWPVCGPRPPPDASGLSLMLCVVPSTASHGFVVGFILVSAGLVSSLGHLGQPQRAWRALSQWRSSWLSREGIAALLTFVPAIGFIGLEFAAWVQMRGHSMGDVYQASLDDASIQRALAVLLALGSLLTVFCTAHIYSSLKPIRAWHNRHVVPVFLLLGLYSGTLLAWVCAALPGWRTAKADMQVLFVGVMTLAALSALLKWLYWRHVDSSPLIGAGHATGLESLGVVRSFEQPHTEENYLTHEMGFVLARKHARKLRIILMVFGFLVPATMAVLALAVPPLQMLAGCLALIAGITGIFVERWLFFAEAKHAVMAYYGR